jgi:fructose-1,6-bisphosphatase/inositol monophosphatase family enzyme
MSVGSLDIERVTALLNRAVGELVMPSFRRLGLGDVEHKATPGMLEDVVSRVDREVEAWLAPELAALVEGSEVIGEEATHIEPARLARLHTAEWVWLIDPIDGTRGFVDGTDHFGTMIALLERGKTRAAWIDLPARSQTFVAELGSGTYRNGERLRLAGEDTRLVPRGNLYTTFMTDALRNRVLAWPPQRFTPGEPSGCAALEYTNLAQGQKDFVVYHRLLPWDHAPGALVLSEAGGSTVHLDGSTYSARSTDQVTVCAGTERVSALVRQWLLT